MAWTKAEDDRLFELIQNRSNTFMEMAKSFPGRTAQDLRNRWRSPYFEHRELVQDLLVVSRPCSSCVRLCAPADVTTHTYFFPPIFCSLYIETCVGQKGQKGQGQAQGQGQRVDRG